MHLVQSMAYVNETPWHGLGNRLVPHQPIEVWAQQAGMDWSIQEAPVSFINEDTASTKTIHAFPEQKVLYRSDTKFPLSVVSSRYQTVQPREILEFYLDLTEIGGYELETAGVLKDGKKLWALARTGDSVTLKGNDVVNGYLLLATACDGTLATTAQFTSVRVVCNNTLHIALSEGTGVVKVSHRSQFDAQAVKQQLGVAVSSWDTFMYQMRMLADRKVSATQASKYIERVLEIDTPMKADSATIPNATRALKTIHTLFEGEGIGAGMASTSGTAWGLLNAVTQYVDHERKARSSDHRIDSAWFGPGAALKQKALDIAIEMIA
jgi:phage/plasmid-like protein (TIGR03299 family)